jgi:hypothetical protein
MSLEKGLPLSQSPFKKRLRNAWPFFKSMGVTALALACVVLSATRLADAKQPLHKESNIDCNLPLVVTQLPIHVAHPRRCEVLRANSGEGARLSLIRPNQTLIVLSKAFYSACDPEISFDASHILFAGQRNPEDTWNIYEMDIEGANVRQVTSGLGNCRSPVYQATLYTIISSKPWYQLSFVGSESSGINEYGRGTATNLYSCKLDGTAMRCLTFNLSSDMDPVMMPDGRMVFSSWQRSRLNRGSLGRMALLGINTDGADCAAFCTDQGRRFKHMPCVTTRSLLVFVESDRLPWDGAGSLASVNMRRPLYSYRAMTGPGDGLFHSPSPLPDGRILVSHRSGDDSSNHSVCVLDPATGRLARIFDDPGYHDIQARAVYARPEPDGRSSVVTEKDPHGRLYCLNVYRGNLRGEGHRWLPPGSVKRLRVLEGIPMAQTDGVGSEGISRNGVGPLAQRRFLGEIDLENDGSFNLELPADTPIELQLLDAEGLALRTCSWIWAKNHEPRGCIGCHEDGELTPENVFVDALRQPSTKLTLPPKRRRTVDFRRDVMPILTKYCNACHSHYKSAVHITRDMNLVKRPDNKAYFNQSYESLMGTSSTGQFKYVWPGRARVSPLIWQIMGHNTSRPWDEEIPQQQIAPMPPTGSPTLSQDEKQTIIEWIDLGAAWDGIPGDDDLPGFVGNQK